MKYRVFVTSRAAADIEDIHAYIMENGGIIEAERATEHLAAAARSLADMPHRGSVPRELSDMVDVEEFRQLIRGPWRLFYAIHAQDVTVHLVADGRRDLSRLLMSRILQY